MNLNDYFANENSVLWTRYSNVDPEGTCKTYKPLLCADDFGLSIQAKDNLACAPQSNDGPYTHVEVWNATEPLTALEPYAAPQPGDTGTVYRMVPLELVEQILRGRGEVTPVNAW